jgi:hypothetical protein
MDRGRRLRRLRPEVRRTRQETEVGPLPLFSFEETGNGPIVSSWFLRWRLEPESADKRLALPSESSVKGGLLQGCGASLNRNASLSTAPQDKGMKLRLSISDPCFCGVVLSPRSEDLGSSQG